MAGSIDEPMNRDDARTIGIIFLIISLAGFIVNLSGVIRHKSFMVVPGIQHSWGDILVFALCLWLIFVRPQLIQRALFTTVAILSLLGIVLATMPSTHAVFADQTWWAARTTLWLIAAVLSVVVVRNQRTQ